MTWEKFNNYCARKMGDYFCASAERLPISTAYHSCTWLVRNGCVVKVDIGDAQMSERTALSDAYRAGLRALPNRAETEVGGR